MSDLNALSESFTRQVPNLRRMASSKFIGLSGELRQECVANALALTWVFIYRLWKKGRSDEPGILRCCLWYAVKQTKEGRTPQGCPRAKDAFHQRRLGKVKFEELDADQFVGRFTPVFDQVSFRVDVPAFQQPFGEGKKDGLGPCGRNVHDRSCKEVPVVGGAHQPISPRV